MDGKPRHNGQTTYVIPHEERIFVMRHSLVFAVIIAALFSPSVFAAGSYDPPPNADERLKKAIKHIDRERYDRAISELRKAANLRPENADIQNYLGFAYRKSGKLEASGL